MKLRRISLVIFLISFVAFLSGGTWTFLLSKGRAKEVYRSLEKFARVYDLVKKNYVEKMDDSKLIDGAVQGMFENELDPHSTYMSKKDFSAMRADIKGEFGGLGIEISKKNKMLTVVSPIEDTPAFRAGVKSGDVIVKINKKPTITMSVMDAVRMMRGRPGTFIHIDVRRKKVKNLIPFKIKRAVIQVKSVKYEVKKGFGVVKIRQFQDKTGAELRHAIRKLHKKHALRGLVLDLRNNPGGALSQAIEVVDLFIKKGLIVYTKGRHADEIQKSFAVAKGTEPDYPIVVLINGGSASASEIVTGALQDHKRAYIIGTQSFGKGSVQNVIPLEDGSGIKLTVALYYTPAGRTIQGAGITPDEVVQEPGYPTDILRERDLPHHLVGKNEAAAKKKAKLARKKAKAKKGKDKDDSALSLENRKDVQLMAALDYLKKQVETASAKKK